MPAPPKFPRNLWAITHPDGYISGRWGDEPDRGPSGPLVFYTKKAATEFLKNRDRLYDAVLGMPPIKSPYNITKIVSKETFKF